MFEEDSAKEIVPVELSPVLKPVTAVIAAFVMLKFGAPPLVAVCVPVTVTVWLVVGGAKPSITFTPSVATFDVMATLVTCIRKPGS